MGNYIFEIPIYICDHETYLKKYEVYKQHHIRRVRRLTSGLTSEQVTKSLERSEERLLKNYGGRWHYNQIAGYISLYTLGSEIRGETWFSDAKVIRRDTRKSKIEWLRKDFRNGCETIGYI